MEFSKLTSPSLKDLFVRELEDRILSGELEIGEKLPSERELAVKMGVSRVVINTGLSELARIGFIQMIPRKGAYIADYRRTGTVETLETIIRYNGGIFGKKDMKSFLEFRMIVETLAIELSIKNITDNDIENIGNMLERFKNASLISDTSEAGQAIFDFHHEICVISGNIMLPLIFYSFKYLATMLWERYFQLHGTEDLYGHTEKLYQHLKARNQKESIKVFQHSLTMCIDGIISIYYE
jgi:GntR family transcriptional regulator, transcriptional repressor for pyruvate dehydrogenase complex